MTNNLMHESISFLNDLNVINFRISKMIVSEPDLVAVFDYGISVYLLFRKNPTSSELSEIDKITNNGHFACVVHDKDGMSKVVNIMSELTNDKESSITKRKTASKLMQQKLEELR